ncbi:MAG: prepilin-type N-terminal cleavage/methylation domain-containing protein [Planctomycetes bacterium]|nr:prepilin-type N-terminal cleavage/methylation domain-containing protein [Planctomycetota bacterium]
MSRRAGFTLTELLIVIGILLLLSTLSLAVYSSGRSSDRIRSAARIAQSAFLGAKDRAMNAKDFRGLRLTRDTNGPLLPNSNFPALVNGFVIVQPIPHDPYPAGSIALERLDNNLDGMADSADVLIVHGISSGKGAVDWDFVAGRFASPGQIRIPAGTGAWYAFTIDTTGPYKLASGNQFLRLLVPYTATSPVNGMTMVTAFPTTNKATSSCDIQFGYEVVPFHQPIPLPAGVVVDLRYSSNNLLSMALGQAGATVAPNIDITFSPRGTIAGATGGMGAYYLCLRDIEDAMGPSTVPATAGGVRDPSDPACQGDCLILAVNPGTGLVQTYAADLTDANSDGYADNLFRFAQLGRAAGR